MREDSIKRHIDQKIIKNIELIGPDIMRQDLRDICTKMEKNIIEKSEKDDDIDSILKIKDVRSKYLSLYVFFSKKRIIDLYFVEREIYGWSFKKKFTALLFKEKLELNKK